MCVLSLGCRPFIQAACVPCMPMLLPVLACPKSTCTGTALQRWVQHADVASVLDACTRSPQHDQLAWLGASELVRACTHSGPLRAQAAEVLAWRSSCGLKKPAMRQPQCPIPAIYACILREYLLPDDGLRCRVLRGTQHEMQRCDHPGSTSDSAAFLPPLGLVKNNRSRAHHQQGLAAAPSLCRRCSK